MSQRHDLRTATLGGGCFWCLEAVYKELEGVVDVVSGYAGGARPNPTYQQVSSGATGHAEVVQLTYDPEVIGYRDLLDVFFTIHDPTQLNRQGHDVGSQYRSVIFWHDEEQRVTAQAAMRDLENSGTFDDAIVTELARLSAFYPAEAYHQDYFVSNPEQPYCRVVVGPKVAKARKHFADRLKRLSTS
ncbi:MAG: peptide-methionine (S)-S-oxide reductase MsrA [Aquisalimonadaceae bacterium]